MLEEIIKAVNQMTLEELKQFYAYLWAIVPGYKRVRFRINAGKVRRRRK